MRLIDADRLLTDRMKSKYYHLPNGDTAIPIIDIENAPTIEERKTGRWIIRGNPGTGWYRITCSECGEDVTSTAPCIGFFPNAKVNWDYCPNCGAKNATF